jgi:hypothetical protein
VITSVGIDVSDHPSGKEEPRAKESPYSIDSQASTEASEELSNSEDFYTSSNISNFENNPGSLSQAISPSDLSSSSVQKPTLGYFGASTPDPENMMAPLQIPIALPSPSNNLSCPVRTPPLERETLEKRSHVQLPPISPVSRNCSSVQLLNATAEKTEPLVNAFVVGTPEKNFTTHPISHEAASSCHGKALGRAASNREQSVSRLSASSSPMSDKRLGNQTHTQQTNDRKRKTPAVPSGLLVRTGPLKVAPSPWPQARKR